MGDMLGVIVIEDKVLIILGFVDGLFGMILYLVNGVISFLKECVEVFVVGCVL